MHGLILLTVFCRWWASLWLLPLQRNWEWDVVGSWGKG